ncbi:hypothetical protein JQS43_01415 [Natronosporangium hydrolyticum]|uniref:Tetratricopeptide repeat protein n=1 Tax=Natronosporangium hydrolyticum TaxID=2811111 RepID=A0A895YME3_9ACTN|nr:hypothetical protein [Natronosporangium hydrolyticum]QSB15068.1 hypothetical protein JQS43_01415 [Natronosporangium hydrolyticum]
MADSSYLHRAELLADLGHCEEAAEELAAAEPDDASAQTLLARLRLYAGELRPALAAAEAAVQAAPQDLAALTVYGRALAALGRVDDAAAQAERLLKRGRGEAAAATGAAAILASVRVGQVALDAAWEGVRLAPEQPLGHVVLGVVAAELGLTEIAERAYEEARALEPALPEVPPEAGLARLECRGYAVRLARLIGAETPPGTEQAGSGPGPAPRRHPRPERSSRRGPGAAGSAASGEEQPPGAARSIWSQFLSGSGRSPAADSGGEVGDGDSAAEVSVLARLLGRGALYALLAALFVAWAHVTTDAAPVVAVVVAGAGLAALVLARRRLPEPLRHELAARLQADRSLLLPTWALYAVPVLLLLYSLFVEVWLVVAAVAAAVVAFWSARARR